jgi:hypothetical protein
MSGYYLALVVFVIIYIYATTRNYDTEPACFKFKYDKQMLETIVKM